MSRRTWGRTWAASFALAVVGMLLVPGAASASQDPGWVSAGGNLQNTRFQSSEKTLGVDNVDDLAPKWVFETAGDVSATPAVDGNTVFVPDWAGRLYALDRRTGAVKWNASVSAASGVPFDKSRTTPAVAGNLVIVGTQGSILVPGGGPGGKVLAFDKRTGELVWSTTAEAQLAAIITQSPTVHDGRVYVGVASLEEALAAFVPGYVLSFKGSMLALDLQTGAILWKTVMTPQHPDFTGNAVWGSSPAIDTKRGQVYIATGNNYSVPQSVLDCVAGASTDEARAACSPADNHFDAIMALDLDTGEVRWSTRAIPYDAWTVDCLPFFGDGDLCPEPAGPDYDFGQAPALFKAKAGNGKSRELVGAGQKSGQYWALDPDTGAVEWVTQAGPGGTAGGLQWGSAVDGTRVYTANANSGYQTTTLEGGGSTNEGVWSALDAATGEILWQVTPSTPIEPESPFAFAGGSTSGPVTTANGVVYGCSLDPDGHMYALDAATGEELWKFASGGSCLSGAAISGGMLFWGSGYANNFFGTPNNQLYAFGLPG